MQTYNPKKKQNEAVNFVLTKMNGSLKSKFDVTLKVLMRNSIPFYQKRSKNIHQFLIFILIIFSAIPGKSQNQQSDHPWKSFIESDKISTQNKRLQDGFFMIKNDEDLTRSELINQGFVIIRQLDEKYFIVYGNKNTDLPKWQVNNAWKIGRHFDRKRHQKHSYFLSSFSDKAALSYLKGNNINYNKIRENLFLVQNIDPKQADQLIEQEFVTYLGLESQVPTVDSRVIDLNLYVNTVNTIHNKFPQLNGDDIVLSIQEQKYQPEDIDLIGRDLPSSISATSIDNHATDMATIAAGAGNSFITGRGVAKAATITSSDFADVLPDADESYQELGVSIQNHSYGTQIESFYGVQAAAFDQSANANLKLLHVISSGNQGLAADTAGTYEGLSGFANITGNFKMAKNIITVGSVDTVGRPVSFASKGPAYDGRVKPELVAYSTAGSSNSAALVSGVVTLLQQAYFNQFGEIPSASLIKALLINSARDQHSPRVDFQTGYGSVDAYRALKELNAGHYFSGSVTTGENPNFQIEVPANAVNLKVTVVWNDPAAAPNSNIALINDLDIELTDGSTTWQPWVLNTSANADQLALPATRGTDQLNNIEQVTVENPAAGTYTISITGTDVPQGPQEFYIAYQWDLTGRFEWTYPTSTDNMPYDGETGTYFRWESTLAASTGTLEYSINKGISWNTISSSADLSKGHLRWLAPEINSPAIARMNAGGDYYYTDTFSISRPVRLEVGFNCTDSVLIQWPQVANASQYRVLTLGEKFLEEIELTADTAAIFTKADFATPYFTIEPLFDEEKKAIQSFTIDYALQGVGCYLISYFPSLEDNKLFLSARLGSIYGIDEVIFERQSGDVFEFVAALRPNTTDITIEDTSPSQGPNRHRMRITFLNGEELVSETSLIYFLTERAFMIFPNPIPAGEDLNVYTRSFDQNTAVVFTLINRSGQVVKQEEIFSDRGFVDLTGLEAGLYLYRIDADGVEETGRIVIIE